MTTTCAHFWLPHLMSSTGRKLALQFHTLIKRPCISSSSQSPRSPKQQRIVGLLDEAFAGLATAKANAEKNLQNARALFESHLQSVFTQRGPGWVEKLLEELGTIR